MPDDKGMNPVYVENAFCRAKTLLHDLPCRPNLLRIDNYPEEADKITLQTLLQVGLPAPDESIQEKRMDEGTCFLQEHLYWDLTKGNCQIDKLLLEIIKGDIGGFSCRCSNVHFHAAHGKIHPLAGHAGEEFLHAHHAVIAHVAAVVERAVLVLHPLAAIFFIAVEVRQIFVILEVRGVPDHVAGVLPGGADAGNEIEQVELLRQPLQL